MSRFFALVLAALVPQDAARLEEAVRTLQRERKAYYERLEERERGLQEERRKLGLLERERKELGERRKALEDEVAAARAENAGTRSEHEASRTLETRLAAVADRGFAALLAELKAGLPYDLERRSGRALAGDQAPLDRLEALHSSLVEELEEAGEGALRTEEVELPDGRRKPARVGRVGHVFLFFVTEDGKDGGVKVREGAAWTWRMAGADGLRDLKKAVRILARQDAPGRAPLPVDVGKDPR